MSDWEIHIEGQVQGVGFRPTVARIAESCSIPGEVFNTSSGVTIRLHCHNDRLEAFLQQLKEDLPAISYISKLEILEMPFSGDHAAGFSITSSQKDKQELGLMSPDFGICAQCQAEVVAPHNRRNSYPFISCTQCGPRFSILKGMPYDRQFTSMQDFDMCGACLAEYKDSADARFHSQTNSCKDCGIKLSLYPQQDIALGDEALIQKAVEMITDGKILAVKATAGFLLLADATNATAVALLRKRKNRPKKPLAIMLPNEALLKAHFEPNAQELQLLSSSARPIVLCQLKAALPLQVTKDVIAPGLSLLGICLPADPLLFLIANAMARPMIATSGNLHLEPLQFNNEAAITNLMGIADAVLFHNRDILHPQDDSVCRVAKGSGQQIVLRRSRGLAPVFWNYQGLNADQPILALGADLKSAFALWSKHHVYLSPFMGNLESYGTQERFGYMLNRFMEITKIKPHMLLMDRHPQYHSRHFAGFFPDTQIVEVPHHEAHFAALLWDNEALDSQEPVLGVVWDGLGYGDDGALWGSEFYTFRQGEFTRIGALAYFDYLLGDKMSKEPRIAALALCHMLEAYPKWVTDKFSAKEMDLYRKLLNNGNLPQTSSMGRIFDAVASILGLADFNSYEGEAAMLLEKVAQAYIDSNSEIGLQPYPYLDAVSGKISLYPMLKQILAEREAQIAIGRLGAQFHLTLVEVIAAAVQESGCRSIGFSGGVFQNALLVDLLHQKLGSTYRLLFHRQLSPNDENIAIGQLAWYYIKNKTQKNKIQDYVFGDPR